MLGRGMAFVLFFFAGATLLCLLTFVVYRTGIVHSSRDEAGHLRRRQSLRGAATMLAVLVAMVGFFVGFDLATFEPGARFYVVLGWNLALLLSLVVFDSVLIDLVTIGLWRPRFLKIPSRTTLDSMKIHVRKTFTVGWVFILPIVAASSGITCCILKP